MSDSHIVQSSESLESRLAPRPMAAQGGLRGGGDGHLIRGGRGGSWQWRPRGYDGGDSGGSGASGDAAGPSALPDAMAAADAGGGGGGGVGAAGAAGAVVE